MFIVGAPRSGNTLLSLILSKVENIFCPPELWIALPFVNLLSTPLTSLDSDDSDTYLTHLAVFESLPHKDLKSLIADFLVSFYNVILPKKKNATIIIDKTARYYKIIAGLLSIFQDAKFILLSRNPLDVAASHKLHWNFNLEKLVTPEGVTDSSFDIFCAPKIIADSCEKFDDRCYWLRYEDLVTNPKKIIANICKFIEVPYSDDYLNFSEENEISNLHMKSSFDDDEVWKRGRIDQRSIDQWRQILRWEEIQTLCTIVGQETFRRLNYDYPITNPIGLNEGSLTFNDIFRYNSADIEHFLRHSINQLKGKIVEFETFLAYERKTRTQESDKLQHWKELYKNSEKQIDQILFEKNAEKIAKERCLNVYKETKKIKSLALNENLNLKSKFENSENELLRLKVLWPWITQTAAYNRKNMPRISIVTPSYNQAKWIKETIISVLNQNYPNFEHIIVDGCSNDGTTEIVKKYPHVRFIQEPDSGQSHAINKGILYSTGDIIAYLNSDDVYKPGAFNCVANLLSGPNQIMVVVGCCDYIDETGNVIGHLKPYYNSYFDLLRYWGWERWYCLPQQSTFWRREVLTEIGLFDTRYQFSMDYEMFLRMAAKYSLYFTSENLAGFRMQTESKTLSKTYLLYLEHRAAARRYWPSWWTPGRWYLEIASLHDIGNKFIGVAEHEALSYKRCRHSLKLLVLAVKHWPFSLFYPRTVLTFFSAITSRSRVFNPTSICHRGYLRLRWLISELLK